MVKNKIQLWQLRQRQALPIELKVKLSLLKIKQFYEYNDKKVYVSFSGGKDSTVLLHLVRKLYPDVPAVYVDMGLDYPEVKQFAYAMKNVVVLRPKITFKQVLEKYGYPVISKRVSRQIMDMQNPTERNKATRELYFMKRAKNDPSKKNMFQLCDKWKFLIDAPFKISDKCCDVMKKIPIREYEKQTGNRPFVGIMADESNQREASYLKTGCNNFKKNCSSPLGFWKEDDIWNYIRANNVRYCSIYDTGLRRTGCMFCMFGVHLETAPNRFERMKRSHPQLYKYCMDQLGIRDVLKFLNIEIGTQKSLNDDF